MTCLRCSPGKHTARCITAHGRQLDLSSPRIMYIINLTEDSFSDGGRFTHARQAIDIALEAFEQGADIIDLGAESTRPGARAIPAQYQIKAISPVLKELRKQTQLWISIDTSEVKVIEQALDLGADIINDVRALQKPGALKAVAQSEAAICLMHMQGEPKTMQNNPGYTNVLDEVRTFLIARVEQAMQTGIDRHRIIVDPGFGFGKSLENNIELLNHLNYIYPQPIAILAGLSRKSMLGAITGRPVEQRACTSALAALIAMQHGANIIRVHDLEPSLDAIAIFNALNPVAAEQT